MLVYGVANVKFYIEINALSRVCREVMGSKYAQQAMTNQSRAELVVVQVACCEDFNIKF